MCGRMTGVYSYKCQNVHGRKPVVFPGRSKGEKFFGFSFIKLVNEDGTVLKDDEYELFLYKVSILASSIIFESNI